MKIIILLIITLNLLFSGDITPDKEIKMSGNIMDITINDDDLLYAGTDAGTLEVYDIKQDKIINTIKLIDIHDFMGDLMPPKIYSVDKNKNKLLLLAEGEKGSREVYIHENNKTTKIITQKDKLPINKAKFVDNTYLFLGLMSNEVILYDLKSKKSLYMIQLSQSKFSDFALNEDKTKAIISCESGINYLVDVKSGKILKELKGGNKDNVFKVSFKKDRISAAGQDRIGAVYKLDSETIDKFEAPFLIYATGLSQDATKAAFAFGIDNEIAIFNLESGSKIHNLKGQKSTLNTIVFYNDDTIFSGSDDKFIMKWRLK